MNASLSPSQTPELVVESINPELNTAGDFNLLGIYNAMKEGALR
jgi:hypothetical protein